MGNHLSNYLLTIAALSAPLNLPTPVGVLSALFRGKFLAGLKNLRKAGKLEYHGSAAALAPAPAFADLLGRAYRTNWVAYAKAPMNGPAQVLRYLGRYTHRVAIGNRRIVDVTAEKVTFTYKDRADGDRQKLLTLGLTEFVRRFLLHSTRSGILAWPPSETGRGNCSTRAGR